MTQRQPARALVTAVHNASRAALVMAVVSVALIGTDAAVAVSRHAGGHHSITASAPTTSTVPITVPPTAVWPMSPPTTASQGPHHSQQNRMAEALLAKTYADALQQGAVHAVARDTAKQFGTAVFDDLDGVTGGIQHISIYGGNVEVRVVGSRTYFTGDKLGLTRYMGFTSDEVDALHHQWLQLTAGQTGYSAVTAGVTLAATLHEDRLVAPFHLLPEQTRDGVKVVGVTGRAIGSGAPKNAVATMWVSTGDNPLPVEFDAANRKLTLVQTFTDWGRPFQLVTPAHVFGQRMVES